MIEGMLEYIGQLPTWLQFILFLLIVMGTPTGLIAGVFGILQQRQKGLLEVQMQVNTEKLESLELRQIKVQSDADQAKAHADNFRELITHIKESDTRWQNIIDRKSEREHAMDNRYVSTLERFTSAITDQKDLIEVLAAQIGQIKANVDNSMESILLANGKSRSDIEQVRIEIGMAQQALLILTTRIEDMIGMQETNIEAQAHRHTEMRIVDNKNAEELTAINITLKAMNEMMGKIVHQLEKTQPIPLLDESKNPPE